MKSQQHKQNNMMSLAARSVLVAALFAPVHSKEGPSADLASSSTGSKSDANSNPQSLFDALVAHNEPISLETLHQESSPCGNLNYVVSLHSELEEVGLVATSATTAPRDSCPALVYLHNEFGDVGTAAYSLNSINNGDDQGVEEKNHFPGMLRLGSVPFQKVVDAFDTVSTKESGQAAGAPLGKSSASFALDMMEQLGYNVNKQVVDFLVNQFADSSKGQTVKQLRETIPALGSFSDDSELLRMYFWHYIATHTDPSNIDPIGIAPASSINNGTALVSWYLEQVHANPNGLEHTLTKAADGSVAKAIKTKFAHSGEGGQENDDRAAEPNNDNMGTGEDGPILSAPVPLLGQESQNTAAAVNQQPKLRGLLLESVTGSCVCGIITTNNCGNGYKPHCTTAPYCQCKKN